LDSFWIRATDGATETLRWKLNKEFIGYVDAICAEGVDRDSGSARDIDSYMQLRKTAIGVLPAISVCLHDIDIPKEVFQDPKIIQLEVLAGRLAFLTNVSFSISYSALAIQRVPKLID
jgi:Delta6-protoilludene synthase